MKTEQYFTNLRNQVDDIYGLAQKARAKGYDPVDEVEIPLAMSMAEKVVGIISTMYPQMQGSGIAERILELEEEYGKLDSTISFKIAEEVAEQKFCKFANLTEAIEGGIRIGFGYQTIGVVSSPLEGFTGIKIRNTKDGKEYLEASFSGPIRSAGTTASVVCLMVIDFLREKFGFAKYDPTEDEIKRVWAELEHFHDRVANLQGMPTEIEALYLAERIPIQVAGEPSEKIEVPNYKNLERVDTDFLRSGFCLILAEGLAQKAKKGFRLYNHAKKNGIKMTGFDWIEGYLDLQEKVSKGKAKTIDSVPPYIRDLVAGRPIFGHPSESGSFRFRYGRGRNSGFSAAAVHPATMAITDGFIAIGTQLKIEKPTKGCAVTSCDKIEGPIVKLKNGSVRQLFLREDAKKIYDDVEEIIYLGDILFPFSDVINRNANLVLPGYVEEWWNLERIEKDKSLQKDFDYFNVSLEDAIKLSKYHKLPLHPKHIYYWTEISKGQFENLLKWLRFSKIDEKIILPFTKQDQEEFAFGKRALELLGIPHEVTIENIVINKNHSKSLMVNLGFDLDIFEEKQLLVDLIDISKFKFKEFENVLDLINSVSKFEIKNKAGDFIGSRMGRPEKAKVRKLTGSPNVLFPVGNEGGRLRSVQAACEVGNVRGQFPINYCESCKKETIFKKCESCGGKTKEKYYYYDLKETSFDKNLKFSSVEGKPTMFQKIDITHYLEEARTKLKILRQDMPLLIKGIRGMSSNSKIPENLVKGILRAKYGLQVNKDGTIRMDATELPLTQFKPKEIQTSVTKLIELGYDQDIYGKKLENDNQILELMPHDILIPSSGDNPEEKGEDVFLKICKFIDELLEKFYDLKPYYNAKTKEDLIGKLGVCMAPHNCAGVICRFIGFSNTLGLMASPYMHAAIRRDCFHKDTYVPIKEKNSWKIIKIAEIVNKINPDQVVDCWGTKEKEVKDFSAIGVLNKGVGEIEVKNFSKHTKNKFYEIQTSLGKKIKVTENHKFFIDGKFIEAKNLSLGDRVPLPYKINIFPEDKKEINLLKSLKDEKIMVREINNSLFELKELEIEKILKKLNISKKQFANYKRRDSYPANFVLSLKNSLQKRIFCVGKLALKRDNVSVPIKINLTNELLEVIGLYVAEGYSRSIISKKGLNQVYISSSNKKIRNFIKKTIKNSFGLVPSENKQDRVTFSSKLLYSFFIQFLGCGSIAKEKRIPSLFLNLPLNKLACVLRGYFEGDGSVSKGDIRVCCDTISEGLLVDLEFVLARFGIFAKRYFYKKKPGPKLRDFYLRKNKEVPFFGITKLIIGSDFLDNFFKIGFLSDKKKNILNLHKNRKFKGMRIEKDNLFVYDPIICIKELGKEESYSLNVKSKDHLVMANSIISKNCDGDEAAIMLLGDVLLNFSRKFLPGHRGGTQDAPLVLNAKIDAGEVDDQILDFEAVKNYPLELYKLSEQRKHSSEVEVYCVRDILKQGKNPFENLWFTHDTEDFNEGVHCSSYKSLGMMQEKVEHQMALVEKIRAVDTSDTARLIIERHFMRDLKGNLRSFSTQTFRCVGCNEIVRRPPLKGVCLKCGGKLIFTIHEGGIRKYLEPALNLAKKYNLSTYLRQSLDLVKEYIDSIFGREKEKQEKLVEWF